MSPALRPATSGDVADIMRLERATFPDDAWSESGMRAELDSPHGHYVVAIDDGLTGQAPELIGYAGLSAPRGADQGEVQTIAVAPRARRTGLGRTLMRALIAEAIERGAAELFLEVRADNPPARALYESLGFEAIAVRPGYYQPAGVDAVVMRLVLTTPTEGRG